MNPAETGNTWDSRVPRDDDDRSELTPEKTLSKLYKEATAPSLLNIPSSKARHRFSSLFEFKKTASAMDGNSNFSVQGPSPFARHDHTSCIHLRGILPTTDDEGRSRSDTIRSSAIGQRYAEAVKWGAVKEGAKRRKYRLTCQVSPPTCETCSTTLLRPWACLSCSYMGCFPVRPGSSKDCLRKHWSESENRCSFGTDTSTGAVFCSSCDDVVVSDTLDEVYQAARIEAEEQSDKSRDLKGRARGRWKAWQPSEGEGHALAEQYHKSSCRGVRPLLNLSQTCFLSAILQSLIHNPLLKAYFLSDKHNRHICANGSKGLAVGKPYLGLENGSVNGNGNGNGNGNVNGAGDRDKGCMCCEMDRAFEEFYNEDKSPFGPVTMLYAMWHASAELEGYGQQDAHSFFLAALDQIHAHAKGQMSSCNCIAHQTFAGSLTSTVTCSACKSPSVTVDPIMDVQLDFPANTSVEQPISLASLLRRFCADERVGDQAKGYACSNCGGGQGAVATKQLMVKKLPNVLSFQLKRFAHDATSTKIETPVRFPSELDMRPFTESSTAGVNTSEVPDGMYRYDLFAVVTHEGKLDNGHYWADVLSSGEWWHCDDDKVTPTTLSAVLAQKAYMLFYVKRSLAYVQPPTRLVTSASTATIANGGVNGH